MAQVLARPAKTRFRMSRPFLYKAQGHAKTMSAVLGEIVWLMSQSPMHKQFFISDLEWPAAKAAKGKC